MNRQRIEELAVQSGLAQAADVRAGFIFPPGMEKFAELLIQECAFEAFKFWLAQSDCNEESAQSHIKQHFGVE